MPDAIRLSLRAGQASRLRAARWSMAAAGAAMLATPALARHHVPPPPLPEMATPAAMMPYGPGPQAGPAPCAAYPQPDPHGWPLPCDNGAPPVYAVPPTYPGATPVYTGTWTAPPGYYVAGVVMVPVPVAGVPVGSNPCQPCGESRTVTTTRTVEVPVRTWRPARPVPPRHPPLHDKRVKIGMVKEKRVKE